MRSSLCHFFKTKNTLCAQLIRIVFAVAVSIGDLQSLIAPDERKSRTEIEDFFLFKTVPNLLV
jgi:hypothetical protein